MSLLFSDRISQYEQNSRQTLISTLPVVISVNGRNFKRLCRDLQKPLDKDFAHAMALAMLYTVKEIPGCCFSYQYSDKIFFVLTNKKNQPTWNNNLVQDLVSTTSSLVTKGLEKSLALTQLQTVGDTIFSANAFNLPKTSEVVNYFIYQQNKCKNFTLKKYTKNILITKLGRHKALDLLDSAKISFVEDLLKKYANLSVDQLPDQFYRGYALYKTPFLTSITGITEHKNKWHLNDSPPFFVEDKYFIYNIIKNGHDILRSV